MRIKSITPLSDAELNLIRETLKESDTPDQSLYSAFPCGFHHMTDDTLYFGAHSYDYTYEIVVEK